MALTVLGDGSIGSAAAERLKETGYDVEHLGAAQWHDRRSHPTGTFVCAVTTSGQVGTILEEVRPGSTVLDLTTHGPSAAADLQDLATERGVALACGGITGGAAAVRAGAAGVLLGPPPFGITSQVAEAIGPVITFPDAASAARAKLEHNTYSLTTQTMIWSILRTYDDVGDRDRLLAVLETGTAGRPLAQSSIVRDARSSSTQSSYRAGLVQKDISLIRTQLETTNWIDGALDELFSALDNADPMTAFTTHLIGRLDADE